MAPSAITEQTASNVISLKEAEGGIGEVGEVKTHVHGAEDLTPLQAISHGPIVMQGNPSLTYPYLLMSMITHSIFLESFLLST
jgi:hypothetical protein